LDEIRKSIKGRDFYGHPTFQPFRPSLNPRPSKVLESSGVEAKLNEYLAQIRRQRNLLPYEVPSQEMFSRVERGQFIPLKSASYSPSKIALDRLNYKVRGTNMRIADDLAIQYIRQLNN
jgi:hypothetical protein